MVGLAPGLLGLMCRSCFEAELFGYKDLTCGDFYNSVVQLGDFDL